MENQRDNNMIEINLMEVMGVLWSRLGLILSVGLLASMVCFCISKLVIAPTYESTTKIYILNKAESTAVTYSDVQLGTQLTKDYAALINSRYVLEEVIQKLSLSIEYSDFLKQVTVETPMDTRIVSITVKGTNQTETMNRANCIREVASEHIQNVMAIDAVNIVETANLPTQKAGPNSLKWTLIGGFLGCFIIGAIILVQYMMDDTIKSSEDVEKYLGLSTLGLIPITVNDSKSKMKNKKVKKNSRGTQYNARSKATV